MQDMELGVVDDRELGCGFREGGGEEWADGIGEVVKTVVEVFDEGLKVGFHGVWGWDCEGGVTV